MNIGKTLVELRRKRGLTQDQMADFLGVKRARYNSWENDIAKPSIEMLDKIADFHKVDADFILGRSSVVKETTEEYGINSAFYDYDNLTEEELDFLKTQLEIFRKIKNEKKK